MDILHEATDLPPKLKWQDNLEAIVVLKEKGYTLREISQWLEKRNIKVCFTTLSKRIKKKQDLQRCEDYWTITGTEIRHYPN